MKSKSSSTVLRRPFFFAAVTLPLCLAVGGFGCPGRNAPPENADDVSADAEAGEAENPIPVDEVEQDEDVDPVCAAYESDSADPLLRWIQAFPINRGGAILVFTGAEAQQMDIEMTLEMAAIMGYEDTSCGTSVIVWIPGMECHGDEDEIVTRIQENTNMVLSEEDSICFRLDEVRPRIREACERGSLGAAFCQ